MSAAALGFATDAKAVAARSANDARLRRVKFQFLPQPVDVGSQQEAGIALVHVTPAQMRRQLPRQDDPVLVLQQVGQDAKLGWRQVNPLPSHHDQPAQSVHGNIGRL